MAWDKILIQPRKPAPCFLWIFRWFHTLIVILSFLPINLFNGKEDTCKAIKMGLYLGKLKHKYHKLSRNPVQCLIHIRVRASMTVNLGVIPEYWPVYLYMLNGFRLTPPNKDTDKIWRLPILGLHVDECTLSWNIACMLNLGKAGSNPAVVKFCLCTLY